MQHPDEGTIHAWLDGALPPAQAHAIEEHAAGCSECAAAIAEARGLVAASSRILSALDSVPGGVLPAADPQEESRSARLVSRRGAAWWRSTPLRAAAAIVLVGSVSWLATRSGVPDEIRLAPSIVMSPAEDRAVAAADSSASTAPAASHLDAPAPAASHMEEKAARRAAPVQSTPAPATPNASTTPNAAAIPPRLVELTPPSLRAAPLRQESANVTAQSTAADMAVAGNRSTTMPRADTMRAAAGRGAVMAAGAMASPLSRSAVEPMPRNAAEPMAKMSAALAPTPIPDNDAVGRLVGCYVLAMKDASAEKAPARAQAQAPVDVLPLSPLLPARIELRADRADDLDPAAMVLRPAAGEPAFASTVRGRWRALNANIIELHIDDGARSVVARLRIAGDSVSGIAQSYADGRRDLTTPLRGRRSACPAP